MEKATPNERLISEINLQYDTPNVYDRKFDLSEYRENANNNY